MPPSFGDKEYWQQRFTNDKEPFDWLLPAAARSLHTTIRECLIGSSDAHPEILHIGCGTSELSLHLRNLVENPRQVHNVDFSEAAIETARGWEHDLIEKEQNLDESQDGLKSQVLRNPFNVDAACMKWSVLDLLSAPSVKSLLSERGKQFDVIMDKSACDAIACGDNVLADLPYVFGGLSFVTGMSSLRRTSVHPLHILAIHLAALTVAGGRWIAVSYASERFPFLEPFPETNVEGLLDQKVVNAGLPDPARLWRLHLRKEVQVENIEDLSVEEIKDGHVVHKPTITYWLFNLVRTEVALAWQ